MYLNEIRSEIYVTSVELKDIDKDSKVLLDGSKKFNWKIEKCERFLKDCTVLSRLLLPRAQDDLSKCHFDSLEFYK